MKRAAQLRELGLTAAGIKVGLHINYASRSGTIALALSRSTLSHAVATFQPKVSHKNPVHHGRGPFRGGAK